MNTGLIEPITKCQELTGKKLTGKELDKKIKKVFKFLWKYDKDLSRYELIHYIAKYYQTSYQHVLSLVGEE
jgi:hypothetical protein